MSLPRFTVIVAVFATFAAVAAIDRGGITRGVLTDLSSTVIMINGVSHDVSQAIFDIDGIPGTQSDLRPGLVVSVSGIELTEDGEPVASHVAFADAVQGPIEEIESDALRVLGQTVRVDSDTAYGAALGDLTVGTTVEVSGHFGHDGEILATRVDLAATGDLEVTGEIGDMSDESFSINDLTIYYANAELIGFAASPEEGDWVEAKGTLSGAALVATSLEARVRGLVGEPGQEASLAGAVTRFAAIDDFDVAGTPVIVTASTSFEDGPAAALALGVLVDVDGELDGSGTMIIVHTLTYEALDDEAADEADEADGEEEDAVDDDDEAELIVDDAASP